MSIAQRTSKEISDNIIAQLESTLNQTIPAAPKSFMRVLSKALGGVFVLLYKYVGWMILQQFVSRAVDADTVVNGVTINPLREWGNIYGVGSPKAATRAELTIDITVTTQGGTLAAGTPLVSAANGVTYITLGAIALNASTVSALVRASADQAGGNGAGTIGNLDAGANLTFVNPLGVVKSQTVVTAQTTTGADGETTDAYRQRILDRIQKQPQGGAYADYELWGEEAAGILNVYPYTGQPGQIDVYSESGKEAAIKIAKDSMGAYAVTHKAVEDWDEDSGHRIEWVHVYGIEEGGIVYQSDNEPYGGEKTIEIRNIGS